MNKTLIQNVKNIVLIGTKKKNKKSFEINLKGSGIIIRENRVISCAHVYNKIPKEDKKKIFCFVMLSTKGKINTYSSFDLELIDKNDKRDIVLFKIADEKGELNKYGVSESIFLPEEEINKLSIGKGLYFCGFPLASEFFKMGMGITLSSSKCIIGSLKYNNKDRKIDFILIDKIVNPGNSGSPVFCGEKIIGLASGALNQKFKIGNKLIKIPVSIGILRPSNYIIDLLKKAR